MSNKFLSWFVFSCLSIVVIMFIFFTALPGEDKIEVSFEAKVEEVECDVLSPKEIVVRAKDSGEIIDRVGLTWKKSLSGAISAEVEENGQRKEVVAKTMPCFWLVITFFFLGIVISFGLSRFLKVR